MEWFLSLSPLILYPLIFFGKIIEVSMATVRLVLITKGEKFKGSVIGFFEVVIWVIITATVLVDITEDPLKVVIVSLAFAFGNYLGSFIEGKIGLGTVKVEAIIKKAHGKRVSIALREMGLGVTAVDAYGKDDRKEVLHMHIPRKKIDKTVKLLRSFQEDVMITINDIRPVVGGHGIIRK